MAFRYIKCKGLGMKGQVPKTVRERFLTSDEVQRILDACTASKEQFNRNWYRDYAAIYLGYMFGLRVGEACILERRHFNELASKEAAHIPTLKQKIRIPYLCASCGKKARVTADRSGEEYPCPRCNAMNIIKPPSRPISSIIPEKDPPVIETSVIKFLVNYLDSYMRPDQHWLFESVSGRHVSRCLMGRIFNTHAMAAGISPKYSWHALRHGRAAKLFSMFKNLVLVRDCLRQRGTQMAELYSHMDPDEIKRTQEELDKKAFEPVKKGLIS